jgi:glucose-1-phosphatase
MIQPTIKNLIFDLGGVILNLSTQKTKEAFCTLSSLPIDRVSSIVDNSEEFVSYELGRITSHQFRDFIRTSMQMQATDEEIDAAWNAMLLDIPINRINTLLRLRNHYTLYLLSNTNEIHLNAILLKLQLHEPKTILKEIFDTIYFSHYIRFRKPDRLIFDFVLLNQNLEAKETLFFDDHLPNLQGAELAGLNTYHVTDANELFKNLDAIQ